MARKPIEVEALKHAEATRKNIPTAEFESVMAAEDKAALRIAYDGAIAISIRSSSGAARTSRTPPT